MDLKHLQFLSDLLKDHSGHDSELYVKNGIVYYPDNSEYNYDKNVYELQVNIHMSNGDTITLHNLCMASISVKRYVGDFIEPVFGENAVRVSQILSSSFCYLPLDHICWTEVKISEQPNSPANPEDNDKILDRDKLMTQVHNLAERIIICAGSKKKDFRNLELFFLNRGSITPLYALFICKYCKLHNQMDLSQFITNLLVTEKIPTIKKPQKKYYGHSEWNAGSWLISFDGLFDYIQSQNVPLPKDILPFI